MKHVIASSDSSECENVSDTKNGSRNLGSAIGKFRCGNVELMAKRLISSHFAIDIGNI